MIFFFWLYEPELNAVWVPAGLFAKLKITISKMHNYKIWTKWYQKILKRECRYIVTSMAV